MEIVDILDNFKIEGDRPIKLSLSRDQLVGMFKLFGYKDGVEIGVERAHFSKSILSQNPGMHLHCVDPLIPYIGYREHVSTDKMDGFFQECMDRLAPYNYTFHRKFSMDAVGDFANESLDFVYIDGNHDFINTTRDVYEWEKKVRKGGIIAGHDYVRNKKKDYKCHVKDVIQAWTYAHDIRTWYITNDKSPSWFWIK